tara:strand:+ start:369 stop:1388 length:1020 start_codon:yes stop_codon:yes gene_type:complete
MIKSAKLFSPGPFGGAEQIVLKGSCSLNTLLLLIKETRNPIPCEKFIERCIEDGLNYIVFECKSQFDLLTLKNLKETITKHNITLIHSHGMKANFYNSLLPVKRIATQHGKTSHSIKTKLLEYIEHLALRRMDSVICVSKKMYNNLKYQKMVLIENFLSFKQIKLNHKVEGNINLVAIGRLSTEKGIADAIKATNQLEDVYLTIVGQGPEEDNLKQLAVNRSNISFVGFQKDISKFIDQADAIIMPSHTEGLPMTLIEASAAGLPIIASNVGGIPSLVHKNGLLFDSKNIDDIKRKILIFKKNRSMFNEEAIKYSANVQKQYSLSKWIEETLKLYNSLL